MSHTSVKMIPAVRRRRASVVDGFGLGVIEMDQRKIEKLTDLHDLRTGEKNTQYSRTDGDPEEVAFTGFNALSIRSQK